MRLDLLEGVRTLQWSGHHSSHASGITGTLSRAAARAGHWFQVPALVEVAAAGGVVPGQLGTAAVGGAGSGVAEAAHQRLGVRAATLPLLQHSHAWVVPLARASQTLPRPLLSSTLVSGRWRSARGSLAPTTRRWPSGATTSAACCRLMGTWPAPRCSMSGRFRSGRRPLAPTT